jgi:hypothetical protein
MNSNCAAVRSFRTFPVFKVVLGSEQDNMAFLICNGHMLDSARYDNELPRIHEHVPIVKTHFQHALHNEEQFIFIFMVVP